MYGFIFQKPKHCSNNNFHPRNSYKQCGTFNHMLFLNEMSFSRILTANPISILYSTIELSINKKCYTNIKKKSFFSLIQSPVPMSHPHHTSYTRTLVPVSYTHLTLPTIVEWCRSRWSPYH